MLDHTTRQGQAAGREPDLLTITEAAELLRAPVAILRYWRHCGTGPSSFRLGRRVLYRRDDLRAWIDARSTIRRPPTTADRPGG
ncbi:DNA binding domain-containing protein, excisionase family [Modestobacter sp. DSM 44400]|uniref:helix-turn-helix transcriptional regulator n=1 Tax=Modestobacter sp. DSM 44400 TaxID=1550230 RepID=UPI00089A91D0|nr:helix-turn-helix domain-containing protein [Modestobacter sp. DSM 44400]SDY21640.1 DNA binding domain-containing protein, excisionase family [Modestobacter sp. DSM 44400]